MILSLFSADLLFEFDKINRKIFNRIVKLIKKFLYSTVLTTSMLFANSSAEININNDTLEIGSSFLINNIIDSQSEGNIYFGLSYLRTKADNNEENEDLLTGSLKVLNPYVDSYGFSIGMGIKTVLTSQYSQSFNAIPLSLYLKYEMNELIYFDLEGSYAPRVLSFMDAETYHDARLRLNYKVLDGGYIYLGLREITAKYENNQKIKYDNSAFFGYEFRF